MRGRYCQFLVISVQRRLGPMFAEMRVRDVKAGHAVFMFVRSVWLTAWSGISLLDFNRSGRGGGGCDVCTT